MALPATYKAVVYDAPGTISTKVVDLPMPEPKEGEVLIKLTHSGVCHSDMGVMTNSWAILPYPTPENQVGGHEGVGEVVKFGPGAEKEGLSLGSRVGIKWLAGICGKCEACKVDVDGSCFQQSISGYYTPGTFQQYVTGPANYVTPIPDGLSSVDAAPMLCAGVTVYAAIKNSHAKAGQWLVISGAGGGLGHIAIQIAAKGLGLRVVGVDHPSKADLIRDSGAEHFVDITQFPKDDDHKAIAEHVHKLTDGIGAHAVIVCTASNIAYAQAPLFLRFKGTVVCVGIPEHASVPIATAFPGNIVSKHLTITGSAVGNRQDAKDTLELAAKGLVKSHSRIEKMDRLTEVFKEMDEGKLQGRVVLDLS